MKRKKIRIASFVAALVAAISIWGVGKDILADRYGRTLMLKEQASLLQFSSYMNEIEDALTKSLYCSSAPMMAKISAHLWSSSNCAKLCLSSLGDSESHLPQTYRYLTQVGDYMLYLSNKAAAGETPTKKEYDTVRSLQKYASDLARQADYASNSVGSNRFSFGDYDLKYLDSKAQTLNFSEISADSEKNISDLPTLIYDGPFADNAAEKEPIMLKDLPEISEEEALKRAQKLLGVEMGNIERKGRQEGNVPCYMFSTPEKSVAVTVRGGYLRYLLSVSYPGEAKISIPEAISIGKKFLTSIGYEEMHDNYYAESDAVATVNYVSYENGVKCYPDLIKVSVSLSNGEIVAFDATQYLISHHKRSVAAEAALLRDDTMELRPELTIMESAAAVIPKDSGAEKLTLELFCRDRNGQDVLIYLDPKTGLEENILLLTYSDDGILTR